MRRTGAATITVKLLVTLALFAGSVPFYAVRRAAGGRRAGKVQR
ncbi:hypothetical protein FHR32_007993 [Streptosporangium album]|uniref:Uncharacterized protein n=1 Tax=Streptosporangium album TaxID=47479 RepID=A0A7W7S481_9ACTN|nr:hypothetical protein [Streptosporangium album]MBB4943593.1 hypothetical protein [Streptosporangium album]